MDQRGAGIWPDGFDRIPIGEPWVSAAVEDSARAYDDVKHHGWYSNLRPTLDDVTGVLHDGDLVIDYSAGTGIFTEEVLRCHAGRQLGVLLVDASPKFLRFALGKLQGDHRTAYRCLRFLKDERRLQRLDDVIPEPLRSRGFDGLYCTNAIHLFADPRETFSDWARFIRHGGYVLVQSGNIDTPDAPQGSWFIDQTVERVQAVARELVTSEPAYAVFRADLDNRERTEAHDKLRRKYFLPIRPLSFYLECFGDAGLDVEAVTVQPVEALVSEWSDFLNAYHEGVLGWAGGCKRIDGRDATPDIVALRKQLLGASLDRLFHGAASFQACWTHIRCRKS